MNKFLLIMVLAVIVSSFSQILLKKSTQKQYTNFIREYLNLYVMIGYVMMFAATLLNIIAYHFGVEYKNGPIIESLGYMQVMILSYFFLKEKITKKKIFGNILVLIGILVFYL